MGQDSYRNMLEPAQMAHLFVCLPPRDCLAGMTAGGTPYFRTLFDLRATLETDASRKLAQWPLYRHWSGLLRLSACFAGTPVTEYSLFPKAAKPEEVILDILKTGRDDSLIVIKDIPADSPLVNPTANAFAAALTANALARGFHAVRGQALAYVPLELETPDACLQRLSAGRRKDLRRKMRKLDIRVLPLGDRALCQDALVDELYERYLEASRQKDSAFELLSHSFFTALLQSSGLEGVVVLYRRNGALVGHNVCLVHNGMLVDKCIGFKQPRAREADFSCISWLVNLRLALEKGLSAYITGRNEPEVTRSLGARFTFTRHLVWIRNPLLRRFLKPFHSLFARDRFLPELV